MNKNKLIEYIDKHSKKREEELIYDFMPSLLEIIERPAHVGGRIIIWSVFGLILFLLIWSSVGKVDIVVSSQGRMIPENDGKTIYAESEYSIDKINVKTGQNVKKGECLIEMKLLNYEETKNELDDNIKLINEKIDIYNVISSENSVDNTNVTDYENKDDIQKIIDEFNEKEVILNTYTSNGNEEGVNQVKNEYENYINSELEQLSSSYKEYEEQLTELENKKKLEKIEAPYDGIVSNLKIDNTVNKIYDEQELLTILPDSTKMIMECYVTDADIVDITEGQKVSIKLNSFPYSDYGKIDGKVFFVSNVLTTHDTLGNVYVINVEIIDDKWQKKIKSGMSGTSEMIIGKRRIIEYLLEPISDALDKSIKEK